MFCFDRLRLRWTEYGEVKSVLEGRYRMLGDIKNRNLIVAKGLLFLLLGTLAAGTLLLIAGSIPVAFLLFVAVWAFCRFYYFAFYVIEHYVDCDYRFAGLGSFAAYIVYGGWRRKRSVD